MLQCFITRDPVSSVQGEFDVLRAGADWPPLFPACRMTPDVEDSWPWPRTLVSHRRAVFRYSALICRKPRICTRLYNLVDAPPGADRNATALPADRLSRPQGRSQSHSCETWITPVEIGRIWIHRRAVGTNTVPRPRAIYGAALDPQHIAALLAGGARGQSVDARTHHRVFAGRPTDTDEHHRILAVLRDQLPTQSIASHWWGSLTSRSPVAARVRVDRRRPASPPRRARSAAGSVR